MLKNCLFIVVIGLLSACSSTMSVPKGNLTQASIVKNLTIVSKSPRTPRIRGGRGFDHGVNKPKKNVQHIVSARLAGSTKIKSVILNGKSIILGKNGEFKAQVYLDDDLTKTLILKIIFYNNTEETFKIDVLSPIYDIPVVTHKLYDTNFFAVVIGVNNYKVLPKLNTPVADAKRIESILKNRYGFKDTKILLDDDATRGNIIDSIEIMSSKLSKNDSLIIFYSGHGVTKSGNYYWQPVDAKEASVSSWIMANSITSIINSSKSNNILIIADSCYAGAWNGVKGYFKEYAYPSTDMLLKAKHFKKSRKLLASGGNEPVEDGMKKHSVFATSLINALSRINKKAFTAKELFSRIQEPVYTNTAIHQIPVYQSIKGTSDDMQGDFVFVKREK